MEGVIRPPSWQTQARCAHVEDPDIFYPERGQSVRAARELCFKCPVRQQCLEFAVEERIDYGVWGGMSKRERKRWALQNGKEQPELERALVFASPERLEKMLRFVRSRYASRQLAASRSRQPFSSCLLSE